MTKSRTHRGTRRRDDAEPFAPSPSETLSPDASGASPSPSSRARMGANERR